MSVNYTKHLNLLKPDSQEYFNINTWNANMNILDEAYAIIENEVLELEGIVDGDGNTTYNIPQSGLYHISVKSPVTIHFPSYALIHVVLAFDTTVYDVTWKKSIATANNIIWDDGTEPTWEASCVYEVSVMHGHAIAYKRNNMTPNGVDE